MTIARRLESHHVLLLPVIVFLCHCSGPQHTQLWKSRKSDNLHKFEVRENGTEWRISSLALSAGQSRQFFVVNATGTSGPSHFLFDEQLNFPIKTPPPCGDMSPFFFKEVYLTSRLRTEYTIVENESSWLRSDDCPTEAPEETQGSFRFVLTGPDQDVKVIEGRFRFVVPTEWWDPLSKMSTPHNPRM